MTTQIMKLLIYFPLNRGIEGKSGNTLIKVIGKYIAVWIVPYIAIGILGRLPLLGNLLYRVYRVWEYYVVAGMALGCYQYFSGKDFSAVTYIGKEDFKRWWSYKQCKIAVITAALVLALIPRDTHVNTTQTEATGQAGTAMETNTEQEEKTAEIGSEQQYEDLEKDSEVALGETEKEQADDSEEFFDLLNVLGEDIGVIEISGIKYEVYQRGASVEEIVDEEASILESIEFEGETYPVVCLSDIYNGWEEFTIPPHIKYIDGGTFIASRIKEIVIPDTVTYMSGHLTFYRSSIERIVFEGDIVTDKEWYGTFEECLDLESVSVHSDVKELNQTFRSCFSLKEVELPENLEIIGEETFDACSGLKYVEIPNCVSEIGDSAFQGTGITYINLPESVTEIGSSAFENSRLKSIEIPKNVTYIRSRTFSETDMEEISIPDNVTELSMRAFEDMPYLKELIIPDTVIEYDNRSGNISRCPSLKKLKYSNLAPYDLPMYGYGETEDAQLPNLELIIFPDTLDEETLDNFYFYSLDLPNLTIQVPKDLVDTIQDKLTDINVTAKE